MKSRNFIEKIFFIFLFSALACFVACSSSDDEKEDLTDTDTVSDEDTTGDTEPSGDTDSEPADDTDTAPDNADSADDSDVPAGDTDTNTDTDTEPAEPTDPAEPTTEEPDPGFEQDAEGCTMIEVPQITMGGSHADEINGYFSPAMGESTIDIIKILLMGDIKTGSYDLGSGVNDNYAQCQQCVMVWVDAALATANGYYFQTHGTLTITEVKDVDGIKRTVGKIKNLILQQAEANEYMSDFILIPDGKCIAAEIVEWDTTNTPGNSDD